MTSHNTFLYAVLWGGGGNLPSSPHIFALVTWWKEDEGTDCWKINQSHLTDMRASLAQLLMILQPLTSIWGEGGFHSVKVFKLHASKSSRGSLIGLLLWVTNWQNWTLRGEGFIHCLSESVNTSCCKIWPPFRVTQLACFFDWLKNSQLHKLISSLKMLRHQNPNPSVDKFQFVRPPSLKTKRSTYSEFFQYFSCFSFLYQSGYTLVFFIRISA